MRKIQTFILRLLLNPDEPQALRGAIRAAADDEEHTFTDGQSLLDLLYRMSRAAPVSGAEYDNKMLDDQATNN